MSDALFRKSVESVLLQAGGAGGRPGLSRQLGWFQLVMIGIGVIIGGGIFIITGTAAAQYAGPAIVLSFVLAAFGCALAGLCYAELAASLPVAGSGYTYAYVVLGEIAAWFVGWNVLMEYVCASSYIAVGWSGYVSSLLAALGLPLPALLSSPPLVPGEAGIQFSGSLLNLPAILVSLLALWVARRGIGLSSRVNSVLVAMKLGVLLLFLVFGARYVQVANWIPFVPANTGSFGTFGWSGVLRGAVVVFVVYLGFDALSTLAQETREPQRNMPIGILGSLAICTLLYIAVSAVLTGLVPYTSLNVPNPLSASLRAVGGTLDWLAPLVEIVAMSGLASVLLIVFTAQARICLAMGQDGLLPPRFAEVHPRHRTPAFATVVVGLAVAVLASLFPVAALSQLVSLGTLCVFIVVCAGVLILRRQRPDLPRPFRIPFGPVVPLLGIAVCLYMLTGVPRAAWAMFAGWSLLGAAIYLLYGRAGAARLRVLAGRATACLFAVLLLPVLSASAAEAPAFDLVLRGGRLLDGAGNPWVAGDIAVKSGRIARIGSFPGRGSREIDVTGKYVAPGFIDMMDQSGTVLLKNGGALNKLRMGVTSVIAGEGGTPVEAAKIGEYFARLERQGIAVNFGTYYRAGQARVQVMGDGDGRPSPEQMQRMRREVATAMRAGAFGISSALIYPPDVFQTTAELIDLAKVASDCGGFYATHMRDESGELLAGIDEAIAIGEQGGVKVEIFHLKAAFAPKWGELMPQAVARIQAARARGVDVAADMYPYTAGGTGLAITVPNWVFADGHEKGFERLRDPQVRARLKAEIVAGSQPGWSNLLEAAGGWHRVVLSNAANPRYDQYRGKSIAEIAQLLGQDPADAAWDIVLAGLPKRVTALFFLMDERDIETALRQPWISIGSDASAALQEGGIDDLGLPHPRSYGTFPRVLAEYVKRRPVLTLEDAVRKMTSWPAARMGLADRGVLREGLRADLVVFDYERIDDVASWDRPTASPTGIEHVVVNGRLTLERGVPTGARAGQVLRHRCRR